MFGLIVLILVKFQTAVSLTPSHLLPPSRPVCHPHPTGRSSRASPSGRAAMGCIQSIACNKSRIRRENVVVSELSATIDHCATVIEESSPIVLRYKTPYFKASARIVMPPIQRSETWVVGWIQACTQMEFYNTYGDIGM